MKRRLSVIIGSLALFLMFFAPSGFAQADETECECPGTVITGAERNQLVADLLKSDEFKTVKKDLMKDGYKWKGAGAIEVRDFSNLESSVLLELLGIPESTELYGLLIKMNTAEILEFLEITSFPSMIYQVLFLDEAGTLQGAGFSLVNGQLIYGGVFPVEAHQH